MCSLEIVVPILGCVTGVCMVIAGVSEAMPFIKKISSNGLVHSVYHLVSKKEKCKKKDIEEVIEDAEELVEDVAELVEQVKKKIDNK
jgi:predicted transcriptional regulator